MNRTPHQLRTQQILHTHPPPLLPRCPRPVNIPSIGVQHQQRRRSLLIRILHRAWQQRRRRIRQVRKRRAIQVLVTVLV